MNEKRSRPKGNTCCFANCSVNSTRCRGLSFHKIPKAGVSTEQDEWRAKLIHAAGRGDRFNPNTATICSRHFTEDCIKTGDSERYHTLIFGSMPTRWLPESSVTAQKPVPRKNPVERPLPEVKEKVNYYNLEDLRTNLLKEVEQPWILTENSSDCVKLIVDSTIRLEVCILPESDSATCLLAKVNVFGFPVTHASSDLQHIKLKMFLNNLSSQPVCTGVTASALQELASFPDGTNTKPYFRHITYHMFNDKIAYSSSVRSRSCQLLVSIKETTMTCTQSVTCKNCLQTEKVLNNRLTCKTNKSIDNIKPNDPLHGMSYLQLKKAYKKVRQEKIKLQEFKEKIKTESLQLSSNLHTELQQIDESLIEDPLTKLFWKEQLKAFKSRKNGMRWHPMMIRLAILIHSRSKAAYETLRTTGVLKLPGTSTLREYINVVQPSEGFQLHVQEELQKFCDKLDEKQRYVCLLHDEMSIKSDLVFNKVTGELIGFVNKDAWSFQHSSEDLATQVLVFYVVGINSTLKMSIGYFATRSISSQDLYPLFWEAVEFVEETGLKVVVSTSDKAAANQKFYQMHGHSGEICYKTRNLCSPDRFIYFMSDAPHLVKTIRNNIASSGSGRNTKLLWNKGKELLWKHIVDLYRKDQENSLHRLPRLTRDHVYLTAHSVMNVRYAAQVMSCRVGSVMEQYGCAGSEETACFIKLVDRFFDCLNSRHLDEANRRRKPDLLPYTDVNDKRFDFLQNTFLSYIEEWKISVNNRPGFLKSEKQKMFLTQQTYNGIVMTVNAFVEVTKYLLQNGVKFILSNKLCQDPLEEHFGRHRALGRSADNPNVYQFGHQETSIRMQRDACLVITPKANVKRVRHEKTACTVSTSPLKKKKKT